SRRGASSCTRRAGGRSSTSPSWTGSSGRARPRPERGETPAEGTAAGERRKKEQLRPDRALLRSGREDRTAADEHQPQAPTQGTVETVEHTPMIAPVPSRIKAG